MIVLPRWWWLSPKDKGQTIPLSSHLLRARIKMKHRFIEAERQSYGVRRLCALLDVSASGYYAARNRPPSARSVRREGLITQIQDIHVASRYTYGSPRVHAELLFRGVPCCRNTVAKLMRQADIVPKATRRFRVTTDSRNTTASPNLLGRAFRVHRANHSWVSDITFIPTREGWLYLAAILDLHSRAVVGWAMSRTLNSELATAALVMAIAKRDKAPTILHSDQGSTYATASYRDLLRSYAIRQSMSRKGNCWDNAPMESFFHTLKTELVMHCDYQTRTQARSSLFDYMEVFYNRQRRHSSNHYQAPLAFERLQSPN
jgi:putative transposase